MLLAIDARFTNRRVTGAKSIPNKLLKLGKVLMSSFTVKTE
jgi:hypothetical protein